MLCSATSTATLSCSFLSSSASTCVFSPRPFVRRRYGSNAVSSFYHFNPYFYYLSFGSGIMGMGEWFGTLICACFLISKWIHAANCVAFQPKVRQRKVLCLFCLIPKIWKGLRHLHLLCSLLCIIALFILKNYPVLSKCISYIS